MSKETERFDQRHMKKGEARDAMQTQERQTAKVQTGPCGQRHRQEEYNHDKHYPLAPDMVIPASLSPELTLLVKSSSTNVATLPLMPMKRFTLVRTT